MTGALEDHAGTVSIGGRTITNLRFANDIEGLAGTETELANLVERLDKTSTAYGMQISAEKTKLMTNNINGISSTIKVSGKKLETVQSFKYLGAIVTDEGSRPKILSRIAQATGTRTNLKVIWIDKNIALNTKIRLLRSLIISIFLYACETRTLTAETEKDPDYGDEKLQKTPWHLIRRTHYERRGSKQNPTSHWTLQITLDHCETTQAAVVWAHYKIFGPCQDIFPGHCARWEKKGQTEKMMGR